MVTKMAKAGFRVHDSRKNAHPAPCGLKLQRKNRNFRLYSAAFDA
jgi:hypothetical protein